MAAKLIKVVTKSPILKSFSGGYFFRNNLSRKIPKIEAIIPIDYKIKGKNNIFMPYLSIYKEAIIIPVTISLLKV